MARQSNFGAILREARERKGMDLSTAARRLRIRPDILSAIEDGDFSRMPPRGYTRNMVNAYARMVGLNASEISRMYNDEAAAFETGTISTRGYRSSDYTGARSRERNAARGYSSRASQGRSRSTERLDRGTRSRQDRGGGNSGSYTNFYAGPANGTGASKMPFIIGAIVVVLIIIIFLAFNSCSTKEEAENVTTVPIAGLTDTSDQQSANQNDVAGQGSAGGGAAQQPAPTSAIFSYTVDDGEEAYIEIYLDGSTGADIAQTVEGPAEGSYNVTGTLRFVTTNPDAVTITVDSAPVELDDNGNGVYVYTVDFDSILSQWNRDHGVTSTGTQPSASSADAQSATASGGEGADGTQAADSQTSGGSSRIS